MGISIDCVRALLAESRRESFNGRLLTLGVQDVFVGLDDIKEMIDPEFELPSSELFSSKENLARVGFVSDKALFKALGFSQVNRLDASVYEGADIIFDLNNTENFPSELSDKFDVIFDGGTLEHVFHLPNALANLFKFLRIGGRIIHFSPSSNHMDHGFYMFSPTFFYDYYHANGFSIQTFKLVKYRVSSAESWTMVDYTPGIFLNSNIGSLDDAAYLIFTVATKTENSTADKIPQQGMYANHLWPSPNNDTRKIAHQRLLELDTLSFCRPNDSALLIEKARILVSLGDISMATEVRKLAASKLEGWLRFQTLGEMYLDTGENVLAIKRFSEAISYNLSNALLRSLRVQAYFRNQQYFLALDDANAVISLTPDDPGAYAQRAIIYEAMNRRDAALADWDTASRMAPERSDYTARRDKLTSLKTY